MYREDNKGIARKHSQEGEGKDGVDTKGLPREESEKKK